MKETDDQARRKAEENLMGKWMDEAKELGINVNLLCSNEKFYRLIVIGFSVRDAYMLFLLSELLERFVSDRKEKSWP